MQLVRVLPIVSFVAALAAAGCGQGNALLTPTGPTGSIDASAAVAVAMDAGQTPAAAALVAPYDKGRGGGKPSDSSLEQGTGNERDKSEEERGKPEKGTKGVLSGFVTGVDGTSLIVRGVTVTPTATAVIRHGNRMVLLADIVVGDNVEARGTMNAGVLEAAEIKVQHAAGKDDDDDDAKEAAEVEDDEDGAKAEGLVSGLTGSCPTLSFMVGAQQVTTSVSTKFEDVACAALAGGMRVEVKGVLEANGTIAATKVERD
jgi:hypothetical protein